MRKKKTHNLNPNKKQSESQKQMILEFLLNGCGLTRLDAMRHFKCLSLPQRVYDLNSEGWGIRKRMIETLETRKRIAEYYL